MQEPNKPQNVIELINYLKSQRVDPRLYKKHVGWFLEIKARNNGIPYNGTFELTPFCNLDCKMCYVHLNTKQYSLNKLLNAEQWKCLIEQAHKKGMLNATLTGGECLMYPAFNEIYLFLYNKGIKTRVFSNGLLIDDERISFFKRYPPEHIQISLYGGSEDDYEAVTGQRVFGIVYRNIISMREANLPVSIAITPNRYMEKNILSLIEKVETLHIPYDINSNLLLPRDNTGRKREDLSEDIYVEIYRKRNIMHNIETMPVSLSELPDESHSGISLKGLRCGGGRSSFTIQYNGKMSPCIGLYDVTAFPLNDGFDYAWEQINNLANNYPLPAECSDCIYYHNCIRCPAMHKNAPHSGHCDPSICSKTKRLVLEGIIPMPQVKEHSCNSEITSIE